ncbi:lysine transporter LysE [Niallia circulans]|jgi:cysteine/O-acetylserine efflux protein|uniref:Amino acid transporter LysE n=1 Tax=Niallia circulans TaxID=1397 RepID=A0A0J1LCM4_NIACI|nr:LysE family transporter [Niallia circulans]KLV26705.1 amino acid transporter LysE [Niallia circulans]MCM2981630.1 LysE family transporter [Niallia circulans]MDR4317052.1 lysine transporter LysE [Niallia circulans]MED3838032.1 LysE family transporter [Niallia circulans]MED4241638.1 LysE family transporter [Niallia circulans]
MPFLSFLLFVLVSSFTPGPNNFMAMSFANKYGFKKTIKFSLGVSAGFFVLALMCSIFNLLLISILPIIKIPLTILGVGYILYLAYKTLTSKGINNNEKNDETNKNLFLIGVLIQFINPKGILYGITVVSTFILPYYTSYFSYFIFSLFLGIIGFLSSLCWSIFGSIFQKSLSKYQKPFNIIMALLLIYSAISIVLH